MEAVLVNVLVRATPSPSLAFRPWPAGRTRWETDPGRRGVLGSPEQRAPWLPRFHLHRVLSAEASSRRGAQRAGAPCRVRQEESSAHPRPPRWAVGGSEPQGQGGVCSPQLTGRWTSSEPPPARPPSIFHGQARLSADELGRDKCSRIEP